MQNNYFSYSNIEGYLESLDRGVLTQTAEFRFGDIHIDLVQDFKESPLGLIVFLPSAQSRSLPPRVPYFPRWSWKESFPDYDFLVLSDPILRKNPSVHSSWFLDNDVDVLKNLANFLESLIAERSYGLETCLLYGSSMGGFASISLASLLPGSRAVAEVPQIDMTKFPDQEAVIEVNLMLGGGDGLAELCGRAPERSNVVSRVESTGCLPPTLIITNRGDSAFGEHMDFVGQSGGILSKMNLIAPVSLYVDSSHSGHTVLNRSTVSKIISDFLRSSPIMKRVRGISPPLDGLPLLEPIWNSFGDLPMSLDGELRWFRSGLEQGHGFRLNLLLKNSGNEDTKAAVIAFDIDGLSEARVTSLGLQRSSHKGIGYFKYLALSQGMNEISLGFSLATNEKLNGIGLLAWSISELTVENIIVSD